MWNIELIGGYLESNFEKIIFGVNDVFDGFASKQRRELYCELHFAFYIEYEFLWPEKKTRIELHCRVEPNFTLVCHIASHESTNLPDKSDLDNV